MLAATIKAKYPQYANVPDAQLEQAVIAKYPQYSPYATQQKTVGGFVGNIGKSGFQAVKDIGSGILNVLNPSLEDNTVVNLGRLAFDSGVALSGNADENNRAIQVVNYYKDRYGKNLGDTLYNDPVGVLLDASTILDGGGGALKATKISKLAKAGDIASKAGRFIDPLTVPGRIVDAGVRKLPPNLFRKAGNKLSDASEQLLTKGIGNPAKQAELERKYGFKTGEFIRKHNIYDRSFDTAEEVRKGIGKDYSARSFNSDKAIDPSTLFNAIDDEIKTMSEGVGKYSDNNLAAIEELKRRRSQLEEFFGVGEGEIPTSADVSKLAQYRQTLDKDIPKSQFALDAKGSGTAAGAKKTRDFLKAAIDSSDPELDRLGREYGFSKNFADILKKSESRSKNRQVFNFTKLGTAGLGGYLGGLPGAIGGYVAEQAVNHPQVIKYTSKALDKTADTLKNSKMPKVPNVFSTVGKSAYNVGKYDRLLSPYETISTPKVEQSTQQSQLKNQPSHIVPSPTQIKGKIPKTKVPTGVAFGKFKKLTKGGFY